MAYVPCAAASGTRQPCVASPGTTRSLDAAHPQWGFCSPRAGATASAPPAALVAEVESGWPSQSAHPSWALMPTFSVPLQPASRHCFLSSPDTGPASVSAGFGPPCLPVAPSPSACSHFYHLLVLTSDLMPFALLHTCTQVSPSLAVLLSALWHLVS